MGLVLKCTVFGKIILAIIEILIELQFQKDIYLVSSHVSNRTPLTLKEPGFQPILTLIRFWVILPN